MNVAIRLATASLVLIVAALGNSSVSNAFADELLGTSTLSIASIRQAVEDSGGTIELDEIGLPIGIDLAAGRGSANESAWLAVLRYSILKKLRIRAPEISEKDLFKIRSLTNLEELHVEDSAISDKVLDEVLPQLPSLRRLGLRNTPNVTTLTSIVAVPGLTHLVLIDIPLEGEVLASLAEAKQLAALDLRRCSRLSGDDLAPLVRVAKLKDLKLGSQGIDNRAMVSVASIENLVNLTIEDASVDAAGLAKLKAVAPQIRSLTLARCAGLDDDALKVIEHFSNLESLYLRDMAVTGEFLDHLPQPKKLESLALRQAFLGDEVFDAIAKCVNLKSLDVSQNFLTPESIAKLTGLSKLESVNLSECGLDEDSIQPLKEMSKPPKVIID